jgi:anti-sigma regulatory factor (Ser/Thr protein kinase)
MHQRLNFSKTLGYVRDLEVGNHGIFFYRSPHEKHEVLFNFLQAGCQKGEGAIYVSSQETSKQIRRHMEDFGLNVKALERDGVLRIFDYDGWYMIDGEVDGSRTIMLAQRVFDEVMEIGLKGLRTCGEATCFFEHKKEKELVELELMIGRKFDLPVTVLCAYDVNNAKSLEEKIFLSLIKAHGPVVTSTFAREVKFENFLPAIMDEVLETVFGEIGKETLLRMLDELHSLTPQKIAEDPGSFIDGLEELVGSGAQVIAKSVVRQMCSKMGITQNEMSVGKG